MERDRMVLALSSISPSSWEDFEQFASEFLISDFPQLRTMARSSGDGGRDAELLDLTPDSRVKLQYSVTTAWQSKIRKTVKRIVDQKKSNLSTLIYVTNQAIGADGDPIKGEIFKNYGVLVDIRDQSWFADRRDFSVAARDASETLARKFVDPLLAKHGIHESVAPILTLEEERLAFLHLSIDLFDRTGKNHTKAVFESLVLAVLHGTTHESSIPGSEIVERVSKLVGNGAPGQVGAQIESALSRLSGSKGRVKHIRKIDSYHISFAESQRISERSEHFLAQEQYFERDILAAIYGKSDLLDDDEKKTAETVTAVREFIESMLLDYGEKFTQSLRTSSFSALEATLDDRISATSFATHLPSEQVKQAISEVFEEGSDETKAHLRRLLNSYTVFAILKATPDVQGVLKKVFAGGHIWLDTSFLLPVIAEAFGGGAGALRDLLEVCRNLDTQLYVTEGIIEEIDNHLSLCLSAVRSPREDTGTPYLLSEFILVGRDPRTFASWQEDLRGSVDPLRDIEAYLLDEFGIKVRNLTDEVDNAPADLRDAVVRYWQEKTEKRRVNADIVSLERLAAHDVENTLGVIQARGAGDTAVAGYRHWLITLDGAAKGLCTYLERELGKRVITPVMTPNYLALLMRFRPISDDDIEQKIDRVPVMLDMIRVDVFPETLAQEVARIREEIPTIKPRLLRRKIRDNLHTMKTKDSEGSASTAEPQGDAPLNPFPPG